MRCSRGGGGVVRVQLPRRVLDVLNERKRQPAREETGAEEGMTADSCKLQEKTRDNRQRCRNTKPKQTKPKRARRKPLTPHILPFTYLLHNPPDLMNHHLAINVRTAHIYPPVKSPIYYRYRRISIPDLARPTTQHAHPLTCAPTAPPQRRRVLRGRSCNMGGQSHFIHSTSGRRISATHSHRIRSRLFLSGAPQSLLR